MIASLVWPGRVIALRASVGAAMLLVLLRAILVVAGHENDGALPLKVRAILVVIGAVVGLADTKRKREVILLQNLGVVPYAVPVFWAITIAALEAVLASVGR